MKIRDGFVTNSSSTNFLIISKKEITKELLMEKLGFCDNSPLYSVGEAMCNDLYDSICHDRAYFGIKKLDFDIIKEKFGEDSANIFKQFGEDSYVAIGKSGSDDSAMTSVFATDTYSYIDEDFYLDAKDCVW